MTLQIADIVDSISSLAITGVKIRDMDQIPAAVTERECPILIPEPLSFISDILVERDSAGAAVCARKTCWYSLNYTFCFSPVGSGRDLEKYGEMVKTVFRILDAVIAADASITDAVDFWPEAVTEFGPVPDPAGQYV